MEVLQGLANTSGALWINTDLKKVKKKFHVKRNEKLNNIFTVHIISKSL